MNCPCRQCNGLDETSIFFGNSIQQANEPEEEKAILSLYERLGELHDKLIKAGTGADLVNELGNLIEEVDRIDDKIIELQKEVGSNPKEYAEIQLGEISKKLY